jgi:hypothetical protein
MSTPITYFNQVITSTTSNTLAEVNKIYDGYFFKKKTAKDTFVVVDKFKIDLANVPLIIFDPTPNKYTIELSCGAVFSGRVSLHTHFYTTSTGVTATDPKFYYIYTVDHFLQIVNNALAAAYAVIAGIVPVGNLAPFFTFDYATHIVSLYGTLSYLEGAVNQINVWVNTGLMLPFFEGFDFFAVNPSLVVPLANGRDTRFCFRDRLINQITLAGTLYYRQSTNAQADTVIKWNVCKGVVITSGLRTQREAFPEGQGITTTTGIVNNSLSSSDILMNFDLLYSNNCRPLIVTYTAPSYDKKILLKDNIDLNEISIKFFWYDAFNRLYPLQIIGNDICSLRIGFTE